MTDEAMSPMLATAGGRKSETPLDPALLGRVLAEAKSIQALADEREVVWFHSSSIVEASGLDEAQVNGALSHLRARGELTMAITADKDARAILIYALTEAVEAAENNATRPEAG